jgi:hypothetical protein
MITIYGILTRLLRAWHEYELRRVFRKLGGGGRILVRSGPFRGMELAPDVDPASNLNKVAGSYEAELHPVIGELVLHPPHAVVNIGAAEGYYAVGLARLIAGCRVYAFETDPSQQRRCADTARLNGVQERVVVLGKCDAQALVRLDLRDALLLVDCEGEEVDILQPSVVPSLAQARLLVELHDVMRPGCSRVLWQRFHETHDMTFISATTRNPSDYACLQTFRRRDKMLAVEENRLGVQEWVFMIPKQTPCA